MAYEKTINKKTAIYNIDTASSHCMSAWSVLYDIMEYCEAHPEALPPELVRKVKSSKADMHCCVFSYLSEAQDYLKNGKTKVIYK